MAERYIACKALILVLSVLPSCAANDVRAGARAHSSLSAVLVMTRETVPWSAIASIYSL